MNVLGNVCPVCGNRNEPEAVICIHCGADLDDPFQDPGAKTKTTDMPALSPQKLAAYARDETALPEHGIAVFVQGVAKPAYIDSGQEFVVGRKSETTSDIALDLAPWGGYHLGLSRRHALIRRGEHGYEVLDLGSGNGTWLDDQRLIPHQPYPLASGAHLRLGSMHLFVLYRPFSEHR